MSTTVKIALDGRKHRKRKDGSCPLILLISHDNLTRDISLGYSILPKDWDRKNQRVKDSCTIVNSVTRLNTHLQTTKTNALDLILRLDVSGILHSLEIGQIKERIANMGEDRQSVFSFTTSLITQLRKAQKIGNARVYADVLNAFKVYRNGKDLAFEKITYQFLVDYETDYLSRGNSINGLSTNMRTLRAIFNKAIKAGVVEQQYYPFKAYKIKSEKTKKRALPLTDLRAIIALSLDEDHPAFHARNFFLASYMMYGMSYIDMAFLQVSDLRNGRVAYKRKKSGKEYDIKISDQLNAILDFYIKGKADQDFIFPIIKRSLLSDQYKDIKWARKRYNKALQIIGGLCSIEQRMTSYVSRHSFATQAKLLGIPVLAISEMLGHESISTTQVYLDSLPTTILDSYNEQIMQL